MSENVYMLATHHYPCKSQPIITDDIVLLHGWGSGSNSWQVLMPALQNIANAIALDLPGFGDSAEIADFNLDSVIDLIVAQLPEKSVLVGWSLGGMIAVNIAARYPQKVSRIVTLAANAKFVASRDYETAMPLAVNRQFNKSFAAESSATLKLFSGLLAQGDANERNLLKQVRSMAALEHVNANWLQALNLLASLDNRAAFTQLSQPGLHLLAEKDALVPVAAAQSLSELNPQQEIKIISGAAHAVHWSSPELVISLITEFLAQASRSVLDKKQMAHSFSRAASTYDSVAGLQRDVGTALIQKLEPNAAVKVVLDLGCGTGYFTPKLQALFPQALVLGVDIAEGMLRFASEHQPESKHWASADAEYLPFADQSVDIIYSNFALQWCANLSRLFAELQRVLKPGGECVFTTLGPATLHELKSAWAQVDASVHVNEFHEAELLIADVQHQGFQLMEFEHKPAIMEFEQLTDLTRSLKALGAHNVNSGRAVGLTGRKKIQAFKFAYENFRRDNLLPATYDVFYLKVKKQ
jgi:malonyl-CoA O-methyltransferase